MSSEVLSHPFHVPDRRFDIRHHGHKAVSCLMDQQVPTVVVVLLLTHPEFVSSMPSMIKRRQIARNQSRFTKGRFVFDQITRHLIFRPRSIRGDRSEVVGQSDVRLIDDGRKRRCHLRIDVGVQNQPFRVITANSQSLQRFVIMFWPFIGRSKNLLWCGG